MRHRPSLFLPLFLIACSSAQPPAPSGQDGAAQDTRAVRLLPLSIATATGRHRFDVEVARTPQQQERGLMFRKSLPADGGMLFPMAPPRTASFWMKNTLIPLDMLFIRTDGTIAFIGTNTVPYSRAPVSAGIPVAAVLEIAGGRAAALDIREGDRVSWGQCAATGATTKAALPIEEFCPSG